VARACDVLRSDGVIAVPTDTVYGLATLAQSSSAIKQLYEIKGRCTDKPIAVSVAEVADVQR